MKNNIRNYEKLINELTKIKKYNKMTEVERSQVAEDIVSFCEIIVSLAISENNNLKEERRKDEANK